jgi:hypothetical protein
LSGAAEHPEARAPGLLVSRRINLLDIGGVVVILDGVGPIVGGRQRDAVFACFLSLSSVSSCIVSRLH